MKFPNYPPSVALLSAFLSHSVLAADPHTDRHEMAKAAEIAKAMLADAQHPTRYNISGVWTSGPDLTGVLVQLKQDGQKVTGRGCNWGCLGDFDPYQITGTYKDGILSLRFRGRTVDEKETFRVTFEKEEIRLKSEDWWSLQPKK